MYMSGDPGAGDIEAGKGMAGENQSQSTTQADMALGTRTNRDTHANINNKRHSSHRWHDGPPWSREWPDLS